MRVHLKSTNTRPIRDRRETDESGALFESVGVAEDGSPGHCDGPRASATEQTSEGRFNRSCLPRRSTPHRSGMESSLRALMSAGALSNADATCVRELTAYRTEIASDISELLLDPNYRFRTDRILEIRNLVVNLEEYADCGEYGTAYPFSWRRVHGGETESRIVFLLELIVGMAEGVHIRTSRSDADAQFGQTRRMMSRPRL